MCVCVCVCARVCVFVYTGKLTRLQATPHSGGDKRNYEIEDTARTMHHKQEKMDCESWFRTLSLSLYIDMRSP